MPHTAPQWNIWINVFARLVSLTGTEHIKEASLEPPTRTQSPGPELTVPESSPTPQTEPQKQQTETELHAKTVDSAESHQNVVSEQESGEQTEKKEEKPEQEKPEEQKECGDEAAAAEDVKKVEFTDVEELGERQAEVDEELEEECDKSQTAEKDDDSVLLSEKERQNEEVNEKDNCSASSISSTSSTLEREEREEKLSSDIDAGEAALNFTKTTTCLLSGLSNVVYFNLTRPVVSVH